MQSNPAPFSDNKTHTLVQWTFNGAIYTSSKHEYRIYTSSKHEYRIYTSSIHEYRIYTSSIHGHRLYISNIHGQRLYISSIHGHRIDASSYTRIQNIYKQLYTNTEYIQAVYTNT